MISYDNGSIKITISTSEFLRTRVWFDRGMQEIVNNFIDTFRISDHVEIIEAFNSYLLKVFCPGMARISLNGTANNGMAFVHNTMNDAYNLLDVPLHHLIFSFEDSWYCLIVSDAVKAYRLKRPWDLYDNESCIITPAGAKYPRTEFHKGQWFGDPLKYVVKGSSVISPETNTPLVAVPIARNYNY